MICLLSSFVDTYTCLTLHYSFTAYSTVVRHYCPSPPRGRFTEASLPICALGQSSHLQPLTAIRWWGCLAQGHNNIQHLWEPVFELPAFQLLTSLIMLATHLLRVVVRSRFLHRYIGQVHVWKSFIEKVNLKTLNSVTHWFENVHLSSMLLRENRVFEKRAKPSR